MKLLQPLSFYCDENALRFHILNVGEGLMVLIIFPQDKVMLFDCNVTSETEDELLAYLGKTIPYTYNPDTQTTEQAINIFVNSHRDEDHYRGLKLVNSKFPIRSIWDSGQAGATTDSDDYLYYMSLRRRLKDKDSDNLIVLVPTDIPLCTIGGVDVFCFAAEADFASGYDNEIEVYAAATKIQHTNSIVLQLVFGGTSILLTGDSDWLSWRDYIIPNYFEKVQSEILVASHHGSRSFFTAEENEAIDALENPDSTYLESIDYISPDITLISCGEYSIYHHPNKDAKKLYLDKSANRQVYSTYSFGHLQGYINPTGNYTIVPSRFFEGSSAPACNMQIQCEYSFNGSRVPVINGSTLKIGGELFFSLTTSGGIIEPFANVRVIWEVSNGGRWKDHSHQEIYFKQDNEDDNIFQFRRNLAYQGIHLLRCRIVNRTKGSITRIFKVEGI